MEVESVNEDGFRAAEQRAHSKRAFLVVVRYLVENV